MEITAKNKKLIAIFLLRPANFLRMIYWKILKPNTFGVRLLYINNNEVILVKHSYLNQWYLPGGQVKANETIEEALKREIKEELNIVITERPRIFGIYFNSQESKRDHIVLFIIEEKESKNEKVSSKSIEIKKARYFSLKDLPKDISPGTKRRIEDFLESKSKKMYLEKW